jgi:Fe-S cluster assembly protein SufD
MTAATDIREAFAIQFADRRGAQAGAGVAWLDDLRGAAFDAFTTAGLPTVRNEDWKYTNILPALRDGFEPALPGEASLKDADLAALLARAAGLAASSPLVVLVDGYLHEGASRLGAVRGLRLSGLRARLGSDPGGLETWLGRYLPASAHGFTALNTAFLDDGAVVEVAAGAACEEPVHIVHVSTRRERPCASHPRSIVVAGEGSSAMVVEHFLGEDGARNLTNAGIEIVVGAGAVLGHARVQDEADDAVHVSRVQVQQERGSTYVSHALGLGAALSRTEIAVLLVGEEAACEMAGLYAVDGSRHVDHHLMIDHAAPHTRSSQLYKGVIEDSARGVFTGRVLIRAGSRGIRAVQNNPSLLRGAGAISETRPQLEIYNDDVACNHGASIGRLSDEAMFYLRSRGIEPREARRLLVAGFAAEAVESVAPPALREALVALVGRRMGALGRGSVGGAS